MLQITLIPGDGIGPEVIYAAKSCVDSLLKVEWIDANMGINAFKEYKSFLPEQTIKLIKKTKVALKGPTTTPIGKGFQSVNVRLRKELNLYANVRPCRSFKGTEGKITPFKNINLVIIRENTEDLYSGIEFGKNTEQSKDLIKFLKNQDIFISTDSAIGFKTISVKASRNIIKYAFDYAIKNNRKKVTVVHKANIMKLTDGLFLNEAKKLSKKYPKIKFEDVIVDNMSMQLVKHPNNYDVIVTTNLYGDILSDLCAGLVGGLGMVAGANIGSKYAVFEPVHGSAPKYVGKNKANPVAAISAAVLMLRHLGKEKEANVIENAVQKVVREGKNVTQDISSGKSVGTKEMTDAIIKEIKNI